MPHWALRALTAFYSGPLRNSGVSRSTVDVRRPELEDGLATPPDSEDGCKTSQTWLCHCEYRQIDFCPYCEYDHTVLVNTLIVETTSPTSELKNSSAAITVKVDTSDSKPPPRKLRKTRSNYQQLHYEALGTADILAVKPDSIISDNSRTPLLNKHLRASPSYLPLRPDRRTRNKLEKKGKRPRSISCSDSHSILVAAGSGKVSRRITVSSKSFLRPKFKEPLGPRPKPMSSSIDTTALVSLAWTGEATSPVRSSEFVLQGNRTPSKILSLHDSPPLSIINAETPPEIKTKQPPLNSKRSTLQKAREPDNHIQSPSRPWTLAMAITDDGITDEKLVNDLEEMRIKEVPVSGPFDLTPELHPFYRTQLFDSYAEYPLQADEAGQEDVFPVDSSWTAARQVLLLCRELVRTERRYLASLKTLITNGTSSSPPTSMLPYLPGLIMASEALLERMEANPSAQGVSEAFLACESIMSESFISWCSVVGEFFDSGERLKSKAETEETSSTPSSGNLKGHRSQPIMSRGDSSLSFVIPEPNKIRKNTKSRPTVRDLAIQPTQRIMRHVLLLKELYSLTPPVLPSFGIVESALRVAETTAEMANKAQGHVSFEQLP